MKRTYRNVAFLAELMINILVFSISCAILAGLFGKAGSMARETKEKSFASAEVYALMQTARLRGPEGLETAQKQPDGTLHCYYDKNWNNAEATTASYVVVLDIETEAQPAGTLHRVAATAQSVDKTRKVCEMRTAVYQPKKGGVAE